MSEMEQWWAVARELLSTVSEQGQRFGTDALLAAAALLAIASLWLLARSIGAARRQRREVDELKGSLAEARAQYNSEVKWRSADERLRLASQGANKNSSAARAPQ